MWRRKCVKPTVARLPGPVDAPAGQMVENPPRIEHARQGAMGRRQVIWRLLT